MRTDIHRISYTLRCIIALPFFALGMVFMGLWAIITGKD